MLVYSRSRQTILAKARLLDVRPKAGQDAPPGRFDVPAVMHGLGPCMQGCVRRHLRKLGSWMPGSRPGKTGLQPGSMFPPSCTGLVRDAGLRQTTLAKARLLDARLKAGLDAPPGRFDVPAVMHGLGPCMQGRVRRHLRKLGSWMPGSRPGKTRLRACSMLPPSCTGLTWLDPCVQGCVRRHLRNLGSWMAGSRPGKTRLDDNSMLSRSCTGGTRASRVASDDARESSAPGCPAQGRARRASRPAPSAEKNPFSIHALRVPA